MNGKMLAIQALSPIHVGAGQGAGVIDLPVIREATTGWPYLPGSSIKGVLRDACAQSDPKDELKDRRTIVFGPDTDHASDHAGGIIVGDQHLLCLAVRSWLGGFAWVSCPFAINRWIRDAKATGQDTGLPRLETHPSADQIFLPVASELFHSQGDIHTVYMEDLALKAMKQDADTYVATIGKLAGDALGTDFFAQHFGIVSDTTFGFLTRTAMDVAARNSIDPGRKVVADKALWWEESVPAESIFVGPIVVTPQGKRGMADDEGKSGTEAVLAFLEKYGTIGTLQFGGNATVGRGLATARFASDTAPGGAQ